MEEVYVSEELLQESNVDKETYIRNLNRFLEDTIISLLDISYVEVAKDRLVMSMPVGKKTAQPYGILHGGASVVLAETVASIATNINVDPNTYITVGMEINANHIRSKQDGIVRAIGTPLHKGRTTMVWDIKIVDEEERLICVSRCTMAVIKKERA